MEGVSDQGQESYLPDLRHRHSRHSCHSVDEHHCIGIISSRWHNRSREQCHLEVIPCRRCSLYQFTTTSHVITGPQRFLEGVERRLVCQANCKPTDAFSCSCKSGSSLCHLQLISIVAHVPGKVQKALPCWT
jgi:hypothetical protein